MGRYSDKEAERLLAEIQKNNAAQNEKITSTLTSSIFI